MIKKGVNCVIGENVKMGENVILGHNVIIEDNVEIGDETYIDSNTIIRSCVKLGSGSFIGSNCIVGEYLNDFCIHTKRNYQSLVIGDKAIIRSNTIIYCGSQIGNDFQTGHHVTVRENSQIGDNVSIGTNSDIQCDCVVGNFVRIHSRVFMAPLTNVSDYVWIFPGVILTNDPTPPSDNMLGITVGSFAVIAAGAMIIAGVNICKDSLIAAGAVVTKDVERYSVIAGNPGKRISDIRDVRNKVTGEKVYPWRYSFSKYMPWDEIGFEKWYAELDIEEREKIGD